MVENYQVYQVQIFLKKKKKKAIKTQIVGAVFEKVNKIPRMQKKVIFLSVFAQKVPRNFIHFTALDKRGYRVTFFFLFLHKDMLWVFIRSASVRHF